MRSVARSIHIRTPRRFYSSNVSKGSELLWASEAFRTRLEKVKDHHLYPRIRPHFNPIRVAEFVERFKNPDLVRKYKGGELQLSGQVTSIRRHGSKLVFLSIIQDDSMVQVLCNFKPELDISKWKSFTKSLHQGHSYSFTGVPSPENPNCLRATAIPQLLAPRLHNLPESITDDNTLARFPQLDLIMNPQKRQLIRIRSAIERSLHNFFDERSFTKVSTPILAADTGGAIAEPFLTSARRIQDAPMVMRISPELFLKQLIAGGLDRVYEIGPCFRNEGIDKTHNPEFTTCEFYQAYASLDHLIDLTENLLQSICRDIKLINDTKGLNIQIPPGMTASPFKQLPFLPTLQSQLRTRLDDITYNLPALNSPIAVDELLALFPRLSIPEPSNSSLPHILDLLATHLIEPLSQRQPTFITYPPAILSPLAKSFLDSETGEEVSARAELFIQGVEAANLYEEENSPFVQAAKFLRQTNAQLQAHSSRESNADLHSLLKHLDAADSIEPKQWQRKHEAICAQLTPSQRYYVRVLELGLPPTGGWGCGLDRLVMIFGGAERISDALPFGSLRSVVGMGH